MRHRLDRIGATALAGVMTASLATGCSGSPNGPAPPPTPFEVVETSGVVFSDAVPDLAPWQPPLLDVSAPRGAAGEAPLAVILPPHGLPRGEAVAARQLARALAEAGVVAVIADWSQSAEPDDEFVDPEVAVAMVAAGRSVASCAVAFAVENASEFGADPGRVVVVGQLYGGNIASGAVLARAEPIDGCRATGAPAVSALVALDADWIGAMSAYDGLGDQAWRVVDALAPWGAVDSAVEVAVSAVVSADAPAGTKRCGGRDASWLAQRDPTGEIRDALDAVDAFQDRCVDFADGARAMAEALDGAGTPATSVVLGNRDGATASSGGALVVELGPGDLADLVALIRSSVG